MAEGEQGGLVGRETGMMVSHKAEQRKENTCRLGSWTIYSFKTNCFAVKEVSLLPLAVSLRTPGGVHPGLKIALGIMKCHGDGAIRADVKPDQLPY